MCRYFENCKTPAERDAVSAHLTGQAAKSFQQSAIIPDTPQMVDTAVVADHIGTGDEQEFEARLALNMK